MRRGAGWGLFDSPCCALPGRRRGALNHQGWGIDIVESLNGQSDGDGSARSDKRPKAVWRLGAPVVALSLAVGTGQIIAASASQAATGDAKGRVTIGQAPSLPKGAATAAAPAASTPLSIDIELNTGHAADLTAYAKAVSDRTSPYYHQYLTPSQIAQDFGASAAQISAVKADLKAQGLTVGSVASDGRFLSATATVAQAEKAFSTKIAGYRSGSRSLYANTTAPSVDASIAGDVSGIIGLDDVGYAAPHYTQSKAAAKPASSAASPHDTSKYTVGACSDIADTYSGGPYSNGAGYYTADAISSIYGLSPVVQAGNDGAGVTVAVFELENYDPTGVKMLDTCYGHSTSVSEVKVDGGPKAAANLYTGVGVESALDIENIANLAPGVKIVDYAGPDNASISQIVDTYSKIINDDTAQVVSTS